MADNLGNSGIRAEGIRPVALLRKENCRAWSSKLKAQLKVMDCWRLVTEVELMPPAAAPAGSTSISSISRGNIDESVMGQATRSCCGNPVYLNQ